MDIAIQWYYLSATKCILLSIGCHGFDYLTDPCVENGFDDALEFGRNIEHKVLVEAWLDWAEGWQWWKVVDPACLANIKTTVVITSCSSIQHEWLNILYKNDPGQSLPNLSDMSINEKYTCSSFLCAIWYLACHDISFARKQSTNVSALLWKSLIHHPLYLTKTKKNSGLGAGLITVVLVLCCF